MKTSLSMIVGTLPMLAPGVSLAQGGGMMGGGNWGGWMGGYGGGGGFGGPWVLILLVVVIAGLVSWIVARNRK